MGGITPAPAAAGKPVYAVVFFVIGGVIHVSQVSDPGIVAADFGYNAVGSYTYSPNVGFAPNGLLWVVAYTANNGVPMFVDTGGGNFGTGGGGQAAFNIQQFTAAGAASDAGSIQLIFQLK